MVDERPLARAVAVTGGGISGLDDDAIALWGPATEVVDLGDGVLLPSFGDGHIHPLWGGVELDWAPVRACASVAEVLDVVRRYAAERPHDTWILGGSYSPSLTADGIFDATWLDTAVADRPVLLEASDHHCAWVNSAALRLAGIDERTPDPPSGTIARRADGTPIGTLVEWSAVDLVRRLVPPPTEAQRRAGLLAAARLLAASGVTWLQEAAASVEDLRTYLAVSGELPIRANVALRADPGRWRDDLPRFVAARDEASDGVVSARTVKFFADGIIEAGTAAVLQPYLEPAHSCGLPVWDPAELGEAVAAFDAQGFQAHIHAIGDAGVRVALDAFAHAARVNPPRVRRPVIAHTQLIDHADLRRFADLGVVANFEPLWHCLEPGLRTLVLPRLGARAVLHYATGSILRSGARLSFGSDWPVSSYRPLDGLAVAVTRSYAGGPAWLPEECVTPRDAWRAYTSGVAHQAFEEDRWGRIAVGCRADLVALATDPFGVDPREWPHLPVTGTWLAGRQTYG